MTEARRFSPGRGLILSTALAAMMVGAFSGPRDILIDDIPQLSDWRFPHGRCPPQFRAVTLAAPIGEPFHPVDRNQNGWLCVK
jgi:hypothetical protein